ncbi:hypothetical protein [Sphingobium sp. CR28]|uniref:hypothetical protein n=1 Tax=Sphingobium sp. CR28 TaxID=3400272 RepID=UPI003FF109BE
MRFFAFLSLLAVGFSFSGAARAEWMRASSPHFVVYANDRESDLRTFSERLERYHSAMAYITGTQVPDPSPSNRVTVYVVRDTNQVRKLSGSGNRFLSGFYVPRAGGSIAIVPSITSQDTLQDWSMLTLLHEYAHHFLISSSARALPRWAHEGGAEFFAAASFEKDGGVWIGRPALLRASEIFYAKDVTALDLVDPTSYEKKADKKTYDAFYGKSWLLYHYLTFDETRRGQMKRYFAAMGSGKSSKDAAIEVFGDLNTLESNLDSYAKLRKMSAYLIPATDLKPGKVEIARLSAGEAAIMPALIRSKRGVDEKIAAEVLTTAREVAARFPDDAAVLAALAEAEHDAGNDAEAIAAADKAIAIDPKQTNAYVQKGYSLFRIAGKGTDAEAFVKARAPFVALNRIEPDHPLPLIYYYRSFLEQGKAPTDLAVQGLERAAELAPFDYGLRMQVITQMLRSGEQEYAKALLQPIAYNPHGGGLAETARKMVERIEADPKWNGQGVDQMGPTEDTPAPPEAGS